MLCRRSRSIYFCIALFLTSIPTINAATPRPGDFYASGSSKSSKIALTFDDGPGPNTLKFLDLLDKYQVKATFFILGSQVDARPEVASEIKKRGHEIGSHTMTHENYKARLKKNRQKFLDELAAVAQTKKELVADMKKSRAVIEKVTGVNPTLLRMPHGIDAKWIHEAAKEAGFVLVNWTHGADWAGDPAEKLIPDYLKALRPGGILLLHDGWPKSDKSLAITEAVLRELKEKKLEVVPVGSLIESR